jgi:hypothetical protein
MWDVDFGEGPAAAVQVSDISRASIPSVEMVLLEVLNPAGGDVDALGSLPWSCWYCPQALCLLIGLKLLFYTG